MSNSRATNNSHTAPSTAASAASQQQSLPGSPRSRIARMSNNISSNSNGSNSSNSSAASLQAPAPSPYRRSLRSTPAASSGSLNGSMMSRRLISRGSLRAPFSSSSSSSSSSLEGSQQHQHATGSSMVVGTAAAAAAAGGGHVVIPSSPHRNRFLKSSSSSPSMRRNHLTRSRSLGRSPSSSSTSFTHISPSINNSNSNSSSSSSSNSMSSNNNSNNSNISPRMEADEVEDPPSSPSTPTNNTTRKEKKKQRRTNDSSSSSPSLTSAAALAKARSKSAQMENDSMVYLDGPQVYTCGQCRTHLTSHDDIISKSFHGRHGRAYLFDQCVNVTIGPPEDRVLITGMHSVCDIFCKRCKHMVGWTYAKAYEPSQKYKEGKFIIEKINLHLEESGDCYDVCHPAGERRDRWRVRSMSWGSEACVGGVGGGGGGWGRAEGGRRSFGDSCGSDIVYEYGGPQDHDASAAADDTCAGSPLVKSRTVRSASLGSALSPHCRGNMENETSTNLPPPPTL